MNHVIVFQNTIESLLTLKNDDKELQVKNHYAKCLLYLPLFRLNVKGNLFCRIKNNLLDRGMFLEIINKSIIEKTTQKIVIIIISKLTKNFYNFCSISKNALFYSL